MAAGQVCSELHQRVWSDRIFHAATGCQAHTSICVPGRSRFDLVAIIFGSTGPVVRSQNRTLGHCTQRWLQRKEQGTEIQQQNLAQWMGSRQLSNG